MKTIISILAVSIFLSGSSAFAQSKYKQLKSDYEKLDARVNYLELEIERLTRLIMEPQDSPDVVKQPKQKPPSVIYPGKKDGASGKTGESNQAESANQGDDAHKTGDKGDEKGYNDSGALYGKLGGGGGSALDMGGWQWDFEPRPDDTSSESGKIVFEIKLNKHGKIVSVRTIERSVSNTVALIYEKEVQRLTFSKTSSSFSAPETTTGKITFIIKAK